MARRRSKKRNSKESPVKYFAKPKRKRRSNPRNVSDRVLRKRKIIDYCQLRDVSYEGNILKVRVNCNIPGTNEIILVDDSDVPRTPLSNNNELRDDEKKAQLNVSYPRLPDYTERVVSYKPGDDLNISVTRSIIDESNKQEDTSEAPLPEKTLKTIEQDISHISISDHCLTTNKSPVNSSETKVSSSSDHITIIDESDIAKNKEHSLQNTIANDIFNMTTIRTDRTLNNMYKTIDVAGSDSESDDVILINDCDENDVTYVNTTLRMKRKRPLKKSVIVIDDDSVMEVSTTPTHKNKRFKNNKRKNSNKFVLPSPIVNNKNVRGKMNEFIPQVTSTPARNVNNLEPSFSNYLGTTSNIQMGQPAPSSTVPIRINTNVNIPNHSQNHPLTGTLRTQALQIQQQISDTATTVGWNFLNANDVRVKGLRPIFIDGSNVAMGHVNGKYFSVKGLKICIDYFKMRGHEVTAIVPNYRKERSQNSDPRLLEKLEKEGKIIFTPSRKVYRKTIVPYDDRYIVLLAHVNKGIIVSADNYRDLLNENPEWLDTIENRILTPTWLKDMIMFPVDPLGRLGPKLDEFLRFPD